MGGAWSSNNRLEAHDTQARQVVAAFLVRAEGGPDPPGAACRALEMRVNGQEGVFLKPQWALARPYFALDAKRPDYGTLADWYAGTRRDSETEAAARQQGVLHGPREAPLRWAHATENPAAASSAFLLGMSNTITLTLAGSRLGGSEAPWIIDDMLWPAGKTVYDVPKSDLAGAVTWNGDYSPRDLPFAAVGRPVLQHGSVLLEAKESGASSSTDKFRPRKRKPPQIVSLATLVPPEPFLRAMRGDSAASDDYLGDDLRRQRAAKQKAENRWVVLVGGAHPAGQQGRSASPWFAEVAFEVGRALGDRWATLGKEFRGIVTASGAGFCDSVTWDEEVSRGFCSVVRSEAPVFHIRDTSLVAVEGGCCDVPFGHGVVLDSPAWKDDWVGANRDLVLSLLAQDGLVLYGGLPSLGYAGDGGRALLLPEAVVRYSMLPLRPPLMSVVVGGASGSKEELALTGRGVTQRLSALGIPSDPIFQPLRTNADRVFTFLDDDNRKANLERVRQAVRPERASGAARAQPVPDNADFFWDGAEDEAQAQAQAQAQARPTYGPARGRARWWGGGYLQAKEMAARLPVVYTPAPDGVNRVRAMLEEPVSFRGFAALDGQVHGANATDETLRRDVRAYATNLVNDVANRLAGRKQAAPARAER